MKTPAAIARIAISIGSPEKLRLSSVTKPPKISQIASKRKPMFFVIAAILESPLMVKLNYGVKHLKRNEANSILI